MQIDRYPELTKKAAWRTESDWTNGGSTTTAAI